MDPVLVGVIGMIVGSVITGALFVGVSGTNPSPKAPPPNPTKYQIEPIALAVESHHGKMVVVAKSRTDRTVVREQDLLPLSDELRKYHLHVTTANELARNDGVLIEETTTNDPPDPNTALPEHVDGYPYEYEYQPPPSIPEWDDYDRIAAVMALPKSDPMVISVFQQHLRHRTEQYRRQLWEENSNTP